MVESSNKNPSPKSSAPIHSNRITQATNRKSIPKTLEPSYMTQPTHIVSHQYPIRATVAAAANTTQMEQTQLQSPAPITHQFLTDIINPPSILKYKHLIKTNDKPI